MSEFSGKCDLHDFISGMGGWFDKDGNAISSNQEDVRVLYSDVLKDFDEFKRRTGGVIYQHVHIKEVWEGNQEFIKKHCNMFDYIEHEEKIPDKRTKEGFRTNKYFTYTYWNKEYTQKEINKSGIYVTKEIPFDTLLDLIPYFPYTVSMASSSKDKAIVYISNKSYVDKQEDEFFQHGIESEGPAHYRKKLADAYLEICKDYFLKDVEERTKIVPLTDIFEDQVEEGDTSWGYILQLHNDEIDYMHDIEFVWKDGKIHDHWTSPKFVDEHDIAISKQDVEHFLKDDIKNGNVYVKYVSKLK